MSSRRLVVGKTEGMLRLGDGQDQDKGEAKRSGAWRGFANAISWVYDHVLLDGAVQVVLLTLLAIGVARLASLSAKPGYDGSPLPGGPPEFVARMRSHNEAAYLRSQARLYQEKKLEGTSFAVTRQP